MRNKQLEKGIQSIFDAIVKREACYWLNDYPRWSKIEYDILKCIDENSKEADSSSDSGETDPEYDPDTFRFPK